MNSMLIIAWREFRAYFTSPIAYVYLTVFLVAVNWLFFRGFFIMGQADMRLLFDMLPWVFLFFVPAVAMGKWAEERKQGTLEIIFTLPVRNIDIVVGKFLAGMGLIASALALTLPAALTVSLVGNMDWGPVIGGYVGALLMSGAFLALGLLVSALTDSQLIAFVGGVAACFVMLIIGTPFVTGDPSGPIAAMLAYAGLGSHFASISRGVIDSRDILYYASFIGFFMYLNLKVLKAKR